MRYLVYFLLFLGLSWLLLLGPWNRPPVEEGVPIMHDSKNN